MLPGQPSLWMGSENLGRLQTGSLETNLGIFGPRMLPSPTQHCEWKGARGGRHGREWYCERRALHSNHQVGESSRGFVRTPTKRNLFERNVGVLDCSFLAVGLMHRQGPLSGLETPKSSRQSPFSTRHFTGVSVQSSLSSEVRSADRKTLNPDPKEELSQLLDLLPGTIRTRVEEHPERDALVEIVLDLGRRPMARFPSGDVFLSEDAVTAKDIELAVGKVRRPTPPKPINFLHACFLFSLS